MIHWGVSFGSHDAALAVFVDNKIVFASHSERFSKIKDDPNLCQELIDHALLKFGTPSKVFYYEIPWKKKIRYLQSGQYRNVFEESPKSTLKKFGIRCPVVMIDHHRSHAAAGYYTSGFQDASIVVVDAIGEFATLTIWEGINNKLVNRYQQDYPHSLGLFYSALTQATGFKPNGEEYIFMGMAAWGNKSIHTEMLMNTFVELGDSLLVGMKYNAHRGIKHLLPDTFDSNDLAAAGQEVYEVSLRHVLDHIFKTLPSKNLILMGGCALNCVANSKILGWHPWDNVWIMPNPGDAGSAIGAVLAYTNQHIEWKDPYLGYKINGEYPIDQIIDAIQTHNIAAVASGGAEFGPRALGNRSIFANPTILDIKKQMNWLKKREQFRPFAAVIPEELAPQFFDMKQHVSSPYMQFVFECKDPLRFPGISHIDNTSRIQTVTKNQHDGLYSLLMKYYTQTGIPMLVNTSLNVKGQPLVNDEIDAISFETLYNVPVLGR